MLICQEGVNSREVVDSLIRVGYTSDDAIQSYISSHNRNLLIFDGVASAGLAGAKAGVVMTGFSLCNLAMEEPLVNNLDHRVAIFSMLYLTGSLALAAIGRYIAERKREHLERVINAAEANRQGVEYDDSLEGLRLDML